MPVNFKDYTSTVTGGTADRLYPDRMRDPGISVAEFGTVSFPYYDGGDDSIPIQAAIDYAHANGYRNVIVPDGHYLALESPIYLGKPTDITRPGGTDYANSSIMLLGANRGGPQGGDAVPGTVLWGDFHDKPVIVTGAGSRYSGVCDLTVTGLWDTAGADHPRLRTSTKVGIGVSKAGSGMYFKNLTFRNMYSGIRVGWDGDTLADSNFFDSIYVQTAAIGIDIRESQNDIISIRNCNLHASTCLSVGNGQQVGVHGGNWSSAGYDASKRFAISSVSALNASTNEFTATVAGADTLLDASNTALASELAQAIYATSAIAVPGWGLVPCEISAFNTGTEVITLWIPTWWRAFYLNESTTTTFKADTNFDAALATATNLYCSCVNNIFLGSGITASGVFTERQTGVVTTLIDQTTAHPSTYTGLYISGDPSFGDNFTAGATTDSYAQAACQAVTPYINKRGNSGALRISGTKWPQQRGNDPILILHKNAARGGFVMNDNHPLDSTSYGLWNPTVLARSGQSWGDGIEDVNLTTSRHGGVDWETTPFLASGASRYEKMDNRIRTSGLCTTRFRGWMPNPTEHPRLFTAHITDLGGTPTVGDSVMMHGGTIYDVVNDPPSASPAYHFAQSTHYGWTYGVALAINWSYVGKTNIITMDSLVDMFNGLVLKIMDPVTPFTAIFLMTVVAVNHHLGTVAVRGVEKNNTYSFLPGVKGTTYTGSSLLQQAYDIDTF